MSTSVEQSFIKEYEAKAHIAYQRRGSKLRNTVRNKNNVKGASTTFQKVGKGTASTKSRHGKVPVMNIDHTPVECVLSDHYAGDWVDKLDELKINIPELNIFSEAGAYSLGRKTDELILAQMDTTTSVTAHGSAGMTLAKIMATMVTLGNNDVPDDGDRYCVVGWKQWSELIQIDQFANADYVGEDQLPWKGTEAKRWLGTLWFPHSGLTLDGTVGRKCFWYHKTAVGHASGADIMADITWHGDRAAHFVNNMMSQGAVLIDATGIVELQCTES